MGWGKALGLLAKSIVNFVAENKAGVRVFDQDLNNYQPKSRNNGNNNGGKK